MSTLEASARSNPFSIKVLLVVLAAAIPAFLLEPNGPFGGFWAPTPAIEAPTGLQMPLFVFLGLTEALVFGLGIAFLAFGYPWVRSVAPGWRGRTWAAYLSIAWILVNWWPHDSLHQHVGFELNGLLAIEYGFHMTLMLAGLIVAYFFLTLLRQRDLLR